MESQKYLNQMQKIQNCLLDFIEDIENIEEKYQNLIKILGDEKIRDNQNEFKTFLYMILKIANNHHRKEGFFNKIERILSLFEDEIKKYFLNFEIFNLFKSNKRILLFLIDEEIIKLDKSIVSVMTTGKFLKANYPSYFSNEIKPFIDTEISNFNIEQQQEDHNEKRRIGENDHFIRDLIQKDSKEEFIVFAKKTDFQLNSIIQPSIYETNLFLIKNKPTLIEYAAFFGSIEIFKYLKDNNVQLTPSLWIYAIHGQNLDIIRILEEEGVLPDDKTYNECFVESIKCHHIDIANYIRNNLLKNDENSDDLILQFLKYYNFSFIKIEDISKSIFYYLCKFDYFTLVANFLKDTDIDLNERKILI